MSTELQPPNSQEHTTNMPVPDLSIFSQSDKSDDKFEQFDQNFAKNNELNLLKNEVASLESKLHSLRSERKIQKEMQVSKTELKLLKTQVCYSSSEKELFTINDIVQSIVEEAQTTKNLVEKVSLLEQQIKDTIQERENQANEEALLFQTLDMADVEIEKVKLTEVSSSDIDGIQLQNSLLKSRKEALNSEIENLENPKEVKENINSIARSVFKSYEKKWQLICIGKKEIQDEIHQLKNIVSATESINISLESDIKRRYGRIHKNGGNHQSSLEKLVAQVNNNFCYFKQELDALEREKREIEKKLNDSLIYLNNANEEVEILKKQEPSQIDEQISEPPSEEPSFEYEIENDSFLESIAQNSTLESSLRSHKKFLESDIQSLKNRYKGLKEEAKKSLERKKKLITQLNDKYMKNKLKISEERKNLIMNGENADQNATTITEEVSKNLDDLKSFISSM